MGRSVPVILAVLGLILGCQPGDDLSKKPKAVGDAPLEATKDLDANDPTILKRPFTAEEIRAEMIEGFSVVLRRSTPDEVRRERWTVVAADETGVEIEYATVTEDGSVVGESATESSGWVELRDHATFSAATSTREWATRSTALGDLDGWLYRVRQDDETVNEFFFVPEMPGAPVQMRILAGHNVVFELEQLERFRPEAR